MGLWQVLEQSPGWLMWLIVPLAQPVLKWLWEQRLRVVWAFSIDYTVTGANSRFHLYQRALARLCPRSSSLQEVDAVTAYPSWWDESQEVEAEVQPGYGNYWIRFQGVRVHVYYEVMDSKATSSNAPSKGLEKMKFTFFSKDSQVLANFREYVDGIDQESRRQVTTVWTNLWSSWVPFTQRLPRPTETLFYANDLHLKILEDLKVFLGSEAEYRSRGQVHKRGLLVHGPPGNGKTTLLLWLASQVGMDLATLSCKVDDDSFLRQVGSLPRQAILVLEDVDALFSSARDRSSGDDPPPKAEGSTVSLSLLLNYLDGMLSRPGQIVFLTTNFPGDLDPALRRKGRADRVYRIGNPGEDVFCAMYLSRYGVEPPAGLVGEFNALDKGPTTSDLDEHFRSYGPEDAARLLHQARTENQFDGVSGAVEPV